MTKTLELIKNLREETGAGVLDCRTALEQSGGVYELALAQLYKEAQKEAAKRANRQAAQGRIELYSHGNGRIGVIVEINCETDFAGHSDAFCSFAHEIAMQIAASSPRYVRDEDIPPEVLAEVAQKAAARANSEGKNERLIPRIVEGYLKKFKDEQVLLRQVYARDDQMTITQLLGKTAASIGENIVIRRFARWELAEGE